MKLVNRVNLQCWPVELLTVKILIGPVTISSVDLGWKWSDGLMERKRNDWRTQRSIPTTMIHRVEWDWR